MSAFKHGDIVTTTGGYASDGERLKYDFAPSGDKDTWLLDSEGRNVLVRSVNIIPYPLSRAERIDALMEKFALAFEARDWRSIPADIREGIGIGKPLRAVLEAEDFEEWT